MKHALVALLLSASLHFACFAKWPGAPDWDVNHSIYAAQNEIEHRGFKSTNPLPEPTDDLSRHVHIQWMTHWPPTQSVLYLALMSLHLDPGTATKVLAFLCVALGGIGWLFIARDLDASRRTLICIAIAYPWLSYLARNVYQNDHLACALVPWVYILVMRICPLRESRVENWKLLIASALLAGSMIFVKYSLAAVIAGTGLYVLYLDGFECSRRRIARVAVFGVSLSAPVITLWLMNHLLGGNQYPLLGGGVKFSLPVFAKNIIEQTFGSALGWDLPFIQLNFAIEKWFGLHLFRGTIFVVSGIVLFVWIVYLVRRHEWSEQERQFLVYLVLLTFSLCVTLVLTSVLSRMKWNVTVDGRLSMPISLAWLVFMAVLLGKDAMRSLLRSATLYSLIVPLAFSLCFFAGSALLEKPNLRLPRTKLMWWETYDPAHPEFFSQLEKEFHPDLVVPADSRFMLEFDTPAFYDWLATGDDNHTYWSSTNLKVLAIVLPERQQIFLRQFADASTMKEVLEPTGFPFRVYQLTFQADKKSISSTRLPAVPAVR